MKQMQIGRTGPMASQVVVGLMRIAQKSDAEIRALVDAALEEGVTMFDHADVYGRPPLHHCEARFADAMQLSAADREKIILQSKAGIRMHGFDFSKEHLLQAVDGTLQALKTEYLDILLLHRPDALVEPEQVAEVFDELESAGKVRHFGVSNQTPLQIELLKTVVKQPLICNQLQLSITHAPILTQGLAMNMEDEPQSVDLSLGVAEYSRIHQMTMQAWSPFQHKFFDGTFVGDRERCPELNEALDEIAAEHGITPTGVAVAWITRHPAEMQVVLGTTTPSRVRECVAGARVRLTREEWYRLLHAAGYRLP